MKRFVLMMTVVFTIIAISCKKDHKHGPDTHQHEDQTEMKTESDSDNKEIAMSDAYKCPMDCEKGKTYDAKGQCPICKMNLKKVESKEDVHDEGHDTKKKHNHDEHAGHSH